MLLTMGIQIRERLNKNKTFHQIGVSVKIMYLLRGGLTQCQTLKVFVLANSFHFQLIVLYNR